MTEDEIKAFVADLPGTAILTAGPENGAPKSPRLARSSPSDPEGDPEARLHPFATLVTQNYPGFDTLSQLDRPGVFRLNLAVGRDRYTELLKATVPQSTIVAHGRDRSQRQTRCSPTPSTPPRAGCRLSTQVRPRPHGSGTCSHWRTHSRSDGGNDGGTGEHRMASQDS